MTGVEERAPAAAHIAQPHARTTQLPQYLAGLYALMVVYASLEPFSGWTSPLPGTPFFLFVPWPARVARFDFVINVLAYAPLGFFVALAGDRRDAAHLTAALTFGALLSFSVESAQMYFPTRDASTVDFVSNTAGATLGGLMAVLFNRAGLRRSVSRWRHRVFIDGKSGDLGLALLGIWLLVQVNPGIPLFAATFEPPLDLTRDVAATLLQAAQSAFNVIGLGLFVALLLRHRHHTGMGVLLLIGVALMLKGAAAAFLLRPAVWESWLKPGVSLGVAAGALILLPMSWLPRPARLSVCAVALLSSLIAPLMVPDMWRARAPLAMFDWPYGQLLNFNGLTHAVLVMWPLCASVYLLWLAGQPAWGQYAVAADGNERV